MSARRWRRTTTEATRWRRSFCVALFHAPHSSSQGLSRGALAKYASLPLRYRLSFLWNLPHAALNVSPFYLLVAALFFLLKFLWIKGKPMFTYFWNNAIQFLKNSNDSNYRFGIFIFGKLFRNIEGTLRQIFVFKNCHNSENEKN